MREESVGFIKASGASEQVASLLQTCEVKFKSIFRHYWEKENVRQEMTSHIMKEVDLINDCSCRITERIVQCFLNTRIPFALKDINLKSTKKVTKSFSKLRNKK